ncbi:MAG: YicC family protein [Candidatus Muiribacterium halophilum]|uniref:YicC family protein n=1 Tax=Muiribacterium halophilum TaxID=2053465 RepID=A0A2N5ZJY9_MUIH1|nr:MAG: YicC family protein [Candidatus Muirbacterium halophilum]
MKSMTGYALHSFANEQLSGRIEIKSVNSKNLDIRVRISDVFTGIEYSIINHLKKFIKRGKIGIRISLELPPTENVVDINQSNLENYRRLLEQIEKKTGFKTNQVNALEVLRLPDIMQNQADENFLDRITKILLPEVDKMFEKFDSTRSEEGNELKKFFQNGLSDMEKNVSKIETLKDEQKKKIRSDLCEKVDAIIDSKDYDKKRLEEELLYLAEKLDITEEIIRLKSHIKALNKGINKNMSGKKMDFILQEVNREVNTIASKSSMYEIVTQTVELKDLISQMREQAANIE